MKQKIKIRLGKNQIAIFSILGLATTFFYFANKQISIGGGFSEGIFVGFFLGLTFICSLVILFLFGRMLYLNFRLRLNKENVK